MTKKVLWAIQTKRGGFVTYGYYEPTFNTALFKTRKHAEMWLEDNPYWQKLNVRIVKVTVTVKEFMT
jgi:hypothetical protein